MGGLTLPEGTTKWLGNLLVTFIGACQWIYAFILTACVGMAGGPYSPEIEIDFSGREAAFRTVFLLAFVGLSWFCAYSFTFRRRWAWYWRSGSTPIGPAKVRSRLSWVGTRFGKRQVSSSHCLRSARLSCCLSRRCGASSFATDRPLLNFKFQSIAVAAGNHILYFFRTRIISH